MVITLPTLCEIMIHRLIKWDVNLPDEMNCTWSWLHLHYPDTGLLAMSPSPVSCLLFDYTQSFHLLGDPPVWDWFDETPSAHQFEIPLCEEERRKRVRRRESSFTGKYILCIDVIITTWMQKGTFAYLHSPGTASTGEDLLSSLSHPSSPLSWLAKMKNDFSTDGDVVCIKDRDTQIMMEKLYW